MISNIFTSDAEGKTISFRNILGANPNRKDDFVSANRWKVDISREKIAASVNDEYNKAKMIFILMKFSPFR